MATTALRPRSVTEIVDAAFQILSAHYAQFVMCSAIAYLPWLVLELFVLGDTTRLAEAGLWAALAGGIGIWITFALMSAVILTCASQAYLGEPVDIAGAVRRALPRLPLVMFAALLRCLLLVLGFMALFVGALYVAARLFALTPCIILEEVGISRAFARTSFLSQGRKGHILNTLGLVVIIYWVGAVGVTILGRLPGSYIVQAVSAAFYTILAYPVIAITEALLYYDARIQSEGLDIELMAEELGAGAPMEPVARLH